MQRAMKTYIQKRDCIPHVSVGKQTMNTALISVYQRPIEVNNHFSNFNDPEESGYGEREKDCNEEELDVSCNQSASFAASGTSLV